MVGFPVLPRCYVFALGIFAAFPSHSRGKTLPCIAHYVFNSQVHYFGTYFELIPQAYIFVSSFLLESFQPRIDWWPVLCQLHDRSIFLPEYHKYWTESYSRRKRLWLRLSRNSFVFFVQRGCLPWCQQQTSVRTPAIGQA